MPSEKLVLSPAPPKFFVYGTKTRNRAGKDCVLSRSLSGPPSVRAVAGLLGLGCWGRRASQNHPEENTCLTHWHRRTMRHHHQLPARPQSDLPAHHPLSGAACWQVSPLLLPLLCASTLLLPAGPGCPPPSSSSAKDTTSLGSYSGFESSDIACQMLRSRCWERNFL